MKIQICWTNLKRINHREILINKEILLLRNFYKKIQPGGPGWKKVIDEAKAENIEIKDNNEGWSVPSGIIAMLLGCVLIYSCLFATGYWIYGETTLAITLTSSAVISGYLLIKIWSKIRTKIL